VFREQSRHANYNEVAGLLTHLKKSKEYEWLNDIHSQVLQQALKDLDSAFKNFFRKLKGGEIPRDAEGHCAKRKNGQLKHSPKFKRKANFADRFRYPQGIKVENNQAYLPKIGWTEFYKSREMEGTIKSATVSQRPSGWYISILCELPDTLHHLPVEPTLENSIGIDVGISSYLVESNGNKTTSLNAYRKLERKLKREQRRLSRKQKGSKNRFKQQLRVAHLHERIANMREDYSHQHSTRLVSENQAVFAEDLNVKGMMKNRHLAKSLADASMGQLLLMLEWKAKRDGKTFHKIDRWYPSSKTCSCCGYKLDELKLSVREWTCPECGSNHDRDINAAINIQIEGLRQVAAGHTETSKTLVEDDRLLSPTKQESPDFSR
jgi:putative transposase